MRGKNLLGPWGEEKAAEYLRRKGYTVEAANYRCRLGEIDLIVRRAGVVAFVEVKLRADDRFAEAREFVDRRKQERLRAAAQMYLSENPTALQPRFDVVEIRAPLGLSTPEPEIRLIRNAF